MLKYRHMITDEDRYYGLTEDDIQQVKVGWMIDHIDRTMPKDILHPSIKSKTFLFITINPKPGPFDEFRKLIEKVIQKKWIQDTSYYYVFEQRKDVVYYTEESKHEDNGHHCHMIVMSRKRKSQALNEIFNTCKSRCTKNSIDIKITNELFFKDKYEYISGVKTGEGKQEKQLGDIVFREKYNLDKIYTNVLRHEERTGSPVPKC